VVAGRLLELFIEFLGDILDSQSGHGGLLFIP